MAKVQRKNLFTENQFWSIISKSKKENLTLSEYYSSLVEELNGLSREELLGFDYQVGLWLSKSHTFPLWAVANVVMGGCSDDGFFDFRMWLISRGKKVYFDALEDPDSLSEIFKEIPEGDIPLFEDFNYA